MTDAPPAASDIDATLAGFGDLLRGRFRRPPELDAPTPLALATRRLAEVLHLKPVTLRQGETEVTNEYLARFAAAQRLRLRRLRLDADGLNGEEAMLAFEADGTPVVLARRLRGHLLLRDNAPARRMTPADWTQLRPELIAFHRVLPDGRLRYRDLLGFGLRGSASVAALIATCAVLGSVLALVAPFAAGEVARIGVHTRDIPFLGNIIVILLVALAAEAVIRAVEQLAQLRLQGEAALTLHAAMLDRLLRLPARAVRGSTQAILATQMEAVAKLRGAALGLTCAMAMALANGAAAGLLILAQSPVAGLVVIAAVVLLVALAGILGWAQFRAIYEGERMDVVVLAFAFDLIRLVPALRGLRAESPAFRQWALNFLAFQSRLMRSTRFRNRFHVIEAGWEIGVVAAAFAAIAFAGHAGAMDVGTAITFMLILGRLLAAGKGMAHATLDAAKLMPMAKLARSLIEHELEPVSCAAAPPLGSGRIEIEQVCFSYGGRDVLHEVSATVEDGAFIGLVGPSGAGKSTLVRLLLGLEQPSAGRITVGGQDLLGIDRRRLARSISVIMQNAQLSPGSIFENIRGVEDIDMAEAWRCAELAGVAEDLRSLPMGLRTLAGEGSAGFSRGQVQRILLARALARRPSILVLDEATNALEGEALSEVLQIVAALPVTRIVVTHRRDTLLAADRILLLQDGRLTEDVSHSAQRRSRLLRDFGPTP